MQILIFGRLSPKNSTANKKKRNKSFKKLNNTTQKTNQKTIFIFLFCESPAKKKKTAFK